MGGSEDEDGLPVDSLLESAAEYARALLAENERLAGAIARLEAAGAGSAEDDPKAGEPPRQLHAAIETLESKRRAVRNALDDAEDRNQRLAARCVEVESEYDTLGSLYVATHQLHSTLDLDALLRILLEVAINLIGAEVLAVFVFDEKRRKLVAVASEGADLESLPAVEVGSGPIGHAVATGAIHAVDATRSEDLAKPIICIPFRRERVPIGAIAIYSLLRQKARIDPLDRELFGLLAGHAATAICTAQLYTECKRKLDTMEGFIELMRPARRRGDPGPAAPPDD